MNGRIRWTVGRLAAGLLVIMVATVLMSAGCGSSATAATDTLKLGPTDNSRTFDVKTGSTIQVVIPGNPTTGYEWTATLSDEDAALLEQVGEPLYAPDSTDEDVVGSGGVYTFTFKATAEGQATLALAYARAWEDEDPTETFTVTVNID